MSAIKLAKVATHHIYNVTHYNSIVTLSKQLFSTNMQLHNYNHDVMLTLLIFIHPLKFDTWYYENFWIKMFFERLISIIYYDC